MTDLKHLKPTKLLWIDLEMTGLDPESQRIVEVAAVVTDFDFKELAHLEALIVHPESVFEAANDWNKLNHGKPGGLFDRARRHGRPEPEVIKMVVDMIREYFGDEPPVLAGNSIHQDRRFIRKWWPEVDAMLHYRILDVSSFKVYMQGKHNVQFLKKEAHQARDDIHESIAELQYYTTLLTSPNTRH